MQLYEVSNIPKCHIIGKELADKYAKLGTEKVVVDSFHRLPMNFIRKKLKESNKFTWQQQWSASNKGREIIHDEFCSGLLRDIGISQTNKVMVSELCEVPLQDHKGMQATCLSITPLRSHTSFCLDFLDS
ncbi:hypothetical protein CEXT_732421 [Caerostris extrusa]|uniref:Uncharacterized protein n=1 Tax=Caerostris extrusa TaxID=172846 RepID=A0AAV4XNC4_CAEEX|nr:hypothetical protein CEXT_732421 [Caerostris extrusa]